jgi:hypothetical protein
MDSRFLIGLSARFGMTRVFAAGSGRNVTAFVGFFVHSSLVQSLVVQAFEPLQDAAG